ncbi:MAG: glycerophosphodiester phosphodiesterase family protein [Verrucomicrobiae bacterium]|nr:glycerophosphodiester phosphodiesterase family protein [Verrucomicrobiae bacterium]
MRIARPFGASAGTILASTLAALVSFVHADNTRAERIIASIADPDDRTILIAAHRGGYGDDRERGAPENSVANVEVAITKGFDLYETDIRRTSDGVFVVIHDDTIDRETNGSGPVESMTSAELGKLKKRFRDGSLSDQPVATLEQLLLAGKDRLLFKADLKPGVVEHYGELVALIDRIEMTGQVIIRVSQKQASEIESSFPETLAGPDLMVKVDRREQVERIADRLHPRTIQVNFEKGEVLSDKKRDAIRAANEHGILVETHSYGSPEEWRALIDAGVRMFHTAVPDKTLKFLRESGWRVMDSSGAK